MRARRLRKNWLTPANALALVAGAALAFAFPGFRLPGLAWLAPGLLLGAALGGSGRQAFRAGYLAGFVHCLISLHWLLYIPFPAGAVAGWLALSAFMALYHAAWAWVCHALLSRQVPPDFAPAASTGSTAWLSGVRRLSRMEWGQRTLWALACGAAWVALEMVRARFLTGFPWNLLGVSQYEVLPLIQIASVTGVYGVSFMVAWGSATLLSCASAFLARIEQTSLRCGDDPTPGRRPLGDAPHHLPGPPPLRSDRMNAAAPAMRHYPIPGWPGPPLARHRAALFADLLLPLLAVTLLTAWGSLRLVRSESATQSLDVGLVQPSIPQRLIFDPRETTNRFDALLELTRLALSAQPDLVVWPEAALPGFAEAQYEILTNLIVSHSVWMVLGADDAEPRALDTGEVQYDYFNAAFLLDPHGRLVASYRKRRLVIFGEYVPLADWLPFLQYLTPVREGFTPGRGPVPFVLDEPVRARIAPLICFEDVFPHLVRTSVQADTDLLLNLTNNGWFGESAAQWQHAANAVFRAIENGLPLVRCANNGLTAWVDPCGRLRDVGFARSDDIYSAGFKTVRVPLPPPHTTRALTAYRRYGDRFGWGCTALTLLLLARRWARPRRIDPLASPAPSPSGA